MTHGAVAAIDACRHLGGLLVGALNGVPKDEQLSEHYCPVPGYFEMRTTTCHPKHIIVVGSARLRTCSSTCLSTNSQSTNTHEAKLLNQDTLVLPAAKRPFAPDSPERQHEHLLM